MGTYSNMCFAFKKGVNLPKELIANFDGDPVINNRGIFYFWYDVKWYSESDWVREIMKVIQPLIDEDNAAILRIGLDMWEDVEEYGDINQFDLVCRRAVRANDIYYNDDVLCIAIKSDIDVSSSLQRFLDKAQKKTEEFGCIHYHFETFYFDKYRDVLGELESLCDEDVAAIIRLYGYDELAVNGQYYEMGLEPDRYIDILEDCKEYQVEKKSKRRRLLA